MNETVTKRFLLYFRLMLLVWILIANAIIHLTGMEYSWLIFLSNIMMFSLEGDVKDRLVTVELGGLVGLVLTVAALLSIVLLVRLRMAVPLALTLCFGFLTIRLEDSTVLDFLIYAVRFFLSTQQYFEWK